jgi:hypothetical protein
MPHAKDLTLRDWFAGQAMAALLAAEARTYADPQMSEAERQQKAQSLAQRVWDLADAVLQARDA